MKNFVKKYGRILLPLITPFDSDEKVDLSKFEELEKYVIENKLCDSIIVTGTTGEASLLTFEERATLFRHAVKVAAGRVPVIAGTGCASTVETIALTKEAQKAGVDLCLVVAPFYNKPSQEGIARHYEAIARETGADILLYNSPVFTGVNIQPETVRRLAAIPNIVGIKDEAGVNPTQITDFILATKDIDEQFAVYNGDDMMLLSTIIQGADGIVSGGAHIFGIEIRNVFDAYERGDCLTAREEFVKLYRFCKICGVNGRVLPNPILRPAIELVTGIKLGPARSPIAPITVEEMDLLEKTLRSLEKL